MTRRLPRAQLGLSLIELMVAMVISVFMILGATQVYIDNKRNYQFQQGQSSNQTQGRMIQLLLDQHVARAGYRAQPYTGSTFMAKASQNGCPSFKAGQTVQLTSDKTGVCYRYQGSADNADVNCLGQKILAGVEVISRISFVSSTAAGAGSLVCSVSNSQVTLVDGLADFLFFALPDTGTVSNVAVRYAALLSTNTTLRDGVVSTVLDQWKSLSGKTRASDQYLYQISLGSVALRNPMQ